MCNVFLTLNTATTDNTITVYVCEALLSHKDRALWYTDCNWPSLHHSSTVLSTTWVHVPVSWLCAVGTNEWTHVYVFAFMCVFGVCVAMVSLFVVMSHVHMYVNDHTRTHSKEPIYYITTHAHTHTHTA